jgi:mono/diheme cytochrome c family protein
MKAIVAISSFIVCVLLLTACGGLAGEPEVVGQVPQQPPQSVAVVQPPNTQPDLARGAEIFAENCVRCHGITGAGDGEFVQSGQITVIPDFTDPAQHDGRTPAEYYTQVTNGNLAKLMPPFSGSLSDEERWSVANYVFTLAGGTAPVAAAPQATEDVNAQPETTTVESPETGTGTVSGAVIQGTAGGTLPGDSLITLHIIGMDGAEQQQLETPVNADGTYQFTDVPIVPEAGYFVSTDYGNGTFNSEFASLTTATPSLNLNIIIYETTDDASVIQINMVLTQVDMLDENTLQIWQLISVSNTSDKLYVYTDNSGGIVSVRVPAPTGVRLSPDNEITRFVFNDNAVYDTRPVIPGEEHTFHLMYTAPFDGSFDFAQTLPYNFAGPYEVYVDSSALKVEASGWQTVENPQTINDVIYRGIAMVDGFTADAPINFSVERSGVLINRQMLGYGIIAMGLVFIVIAALFYWRAPQTVPASEPENPVQALMKQIAVLDDQYQSGAIKQRDYEKQRQSLKDKVTKLMK